MFGNLCRIQHRFRADLVAATHEVGFFYLIGHGIAPEQFDSVLGLARRFFALSSAAKDEISQLQSPQFRGYSRLGGELTNGAVDRREQIDIGPEYPVVPGAQGYWRLQGPNQWPSALPELRPAFEAWSSTLSQLGVRLLRHWAVALDAKIPVIELPEELAVRSQGVATDPNNPIFNTYGENAWKSRTRGHPDVAQLHHGIVPEGAPSSY